MFEAPQPTDSEEGAQDVATNRRIPHPTEVQAKYERYPNSSVQIGDGSIPPKEVEGDGKWASKKATQGPGRCNVETVEW